LAQDKVNLNSASLQHLGIGWRMLHLSVCRHGNHPMGQMLVAYTMNLLHENDYEPSIGDLKRATGLPMSSVSRHISWLISNDYAQEIIDPSDRRSRRLRQTEKGRTEMLLMIQDLNEAFSHVDQVIKRIDSGTVSDAEKILARMEALTKEYRSRQT
jgi:DNA-binding MarR family transcriptional regulator